MRARPRTRAKGGHFRTNKKTMKLVETDRRVAGEPSRGGTGKHSARRTWNTQITERTASRAKNERESRESRDERELTNDVRAYMCDHYDNIHPKWSVPAG